MKNFKLVLAIAAITFTAGVSSASVPCNKADKSDRHSNTVASVKISGSVRTANGSQGGAAQ